MPEQLKEIHVLVYPFWEEPLEQKLKKWLDFVDSIAKSEDKALILVLNPPELAFGRTELFKKEQEFAFNLKQKLENKVLIVMPYQIESKLLEFLFRKPLAEKVLLRVYGQHANVCVEEKGLRIFNFLKEKFPKTEFQLMMHRADSIKLLSEAKVRLIGLLARKHGIPLDDILLIQLKIKADKIKPLNAIELKTKIEEAIKKIKEKRLNKENKHFRK